ncbi:unnamed protein product [Nesidiocoris tenuis]|uniref:Uncharacterized protein n=1 Tax=Nesidiocoris tenuis TaxID=355587 RepID=A0A6H5GE08_9HEMI|nr:unnamed protein product [Nesidiocoris tenuis]
MQVEPSMEASPIRLLSVIGFQARRNDVLYMQPKTHPADSVVVFFPGDVQDYPEVMEAHRYNRSYIRWNLQDMAVILQAKFDRSHIVVIRPSRMEFKMFGCFDNFVPCNNTGVPDHTPMNYALHHLERLLQNISMELREKLPQNGIDKTELHLDKVPNVSLIGFSKGCVVLNQFLYEFHYLKTLTPDDESMSDLVNKIHDMYWLDGGHSGGKNTWITSRSLLETLARLGVTVHIHVTPYQINDDRRPWIRKEEKAFSDWLKKLGAPVNRTVHFENLSPSLKSHLEVLDVFKADVT